MRTKLALLTISLAVLLAVDLHVGAQPVPAHSQSPAALSGTVTSQEEGAMEGVIVNAKKEDSTITVSVVSDKQGHFAFPASRLEPGHYTLAIRAVGYDLDGPSTADVAAHKAGRRSQTPQSERYRLSSLPSGMADDIPGTKQQKTSFFRETA